MYPGFTSRRLYRPLFIILKRLKVTQSCLEDSHDHTAASGIGRAAALTAATTLSLWSHHHMQRRLVLHGCLPTINISYLLIVCQEPTAKDQHDLVRAVQNTSHKSHENTSQTSRKPDEKGACARLLVQVSAMNETLLAEYSGQFDLPDWEEKKRKT